MPHGSQPRSLTYINRQRRRGNTAQHHSEGPSYAAARVSSIARNASPAQYAATSSDTTGRDELNVEPVRGIEHQPQAGHAGQRRNDHLRHRVAPVLFQFVPADRTTRTFIRQCPQRAEIRFGGGRRPAGNCLPVYCHFLYCLFILAAFRFGLIGLRNGPLNDGFRRR